jgi:hypothetical protein
MNTVNPFILSMLPGYRLLHQRQGQALRVRYAQP